MNNDNSYSTEEKIAFLIERQRYDQAEVMIGNAIKQDPDNYRLLYHLACIHYANENHEEAGYILQNVLASEPLYLEAKFLLAYVHSELKRYAEAESIIIDLIQQNPESSDFYALYALIMLETLYIDKADKLAKESLRLEPNNISAQSVSVICEVIKSNKTEYQQRLSELVRNHPQALKTAGMILVVLYEEKKYRQALRIAKELLRNDPNNKYILFMVKELTMMSHITMIPLWPSIKYGWHASTFLWIVGITACYLSVKYLPDRIAPIILGGWFLYILYGWIYPPILKKIYGLTIE